MDQGQNNSKNNGNGNGKSDSYGHGGYIFGHATRRAVSGAVRVFVGPPSATNRSRLAVDAGRSFVMSAGISR
ncbi:hypothetical protein PQU63_04710 [Xanthomonas protegens]|uniref:Uncharacterized protein n=1 Tax=Xanthomonas protegens TaxID=3380705 RepID=A0ABU9LAJ9_9XANT